MNDKSTYKHILKSTSLFGGVQVVQIISTIVRGKIVAIFLGTVGMGISGILVSSISILQTIAGLGLSFSAVREISQAQEIGDDYKLNRTITVFFRWLLLSAVIGMLMLIILAPLLSSFAFGSKNYTWEFVWLSIVIGLNTLSAGYQSVLQGTRNLRYLAKSSILGSILSLLTSFPIYFFWGIDGIVPALIVASLTTFTSNYWFSRKFSRKKVVISVRETATEGTEMAKLGVVMMLSGLISTLTTFLIIAYIKRNGSLSDVGLYQAGLSITSTSLGLVFTAMAVDYFPRLSAISSNNNKIRSLVNQQSEIMLLIITPIVITLLITTPILIRVLLSKEFIPLINFVRFVSIGVLFQAANHSMGLISFAKGDRKTFLTLIIAGNSLLLFFSIFGFKTAGLNGIASFFIVQAIICYFLVYITVYKKYKYWMSKSFNKIFIVSVLLATIVCALLIQVPNVIGYVISVLLLGLSLGYSILKLNSLIGLKEIYYNFVNRVTIK